MWPEVADGVDCDERRGGQQQSQLQGGDAGVSRGGEDVAAHAGAAGWGEVEQLERGSLLLGAWPVERVVKWQSSHRRNAGVVVAVVAAVAAVVDQCFSVRNAFHRSDSEVNIIICRYIFAIKFVVTTGTAVPIMPYYIMSSSSSSCDMQRVLHGRSVLRGACTVAVNKNKSSRERKRISKFKCNFIMFFIFSPNE